MIIIKKTRAHRLHKNGKTTSFGCHSLQYYRIQTKPFERVEIEEWNAVIMLIIATKTRAETAANE